MYTAGDPASCDNGDLIAYMALKRETCEASCLTSVLAAIRWLYRYLELSDPSEGLKVRVPMLKPQKGYKPEEVGRLLAACKTPQERALLLLMARTGLRAGEARRLHHDDIKDGVALVHGKGGRFRQVILAADVLTALPHGSGYLFPSRQGGCISYSRVRQIMGRVGKRAGVQRAQAHRFRRTYAVEFLKAGGDAGALRYTLGHTTLTMSLHYAASLEGERSLDVQRLLADRVVG